MGVHSLKAVQKIPVPLQVVWDFFSGPANLQIITPEDMNFRVISSFQGDKIYAGQIIEYKVTPLLGIPVYWMTEIIHVKDQEYFVDEQRKGPYLLWHHQHFFKEIPGGVEMTDIVHYRNPGWIFSGLINKFLVKPKLDKIFEYRMKKVEEVFGVFEPQRH
ncbi:MAG: SRPBCC family protein [Chitinophagaceae bacterium]